MISKMRYNIMMLMLVVGLAIFAYVFLTIGKDAASAPEKRDGDKYAITIVNDRRAHLTDKKYYCATYSLENKKLTMYDADSNVTQEIVLSESCTCNIIKIQ